jgi:hypothetical protein
MDRKCSKHHAVNAYSQCVSCGESFCHECLSSGKAYGYCFKFKCQKEYERKEKENIKIFCKLFPLDEYMQARKKVKAKR